MGGCCGGGTLGKVYLIGFQPDEESHGVGRNFRQKLEIEPLDSLSLGLWEENICFDKNHGDIIS